MSCPKSPSMQWVHPDDVNSAEDEGVGSTKYHHATFGKSETSSLYSNNTTKISTLSSESDMRKMDDDSGVCNSSKATNSIGSWSDQEGSDQVGNRGYFDYYPQVKIRSVTGLNYEIHEVKSDQSSQDVYSPRSDISEPRDMVTYRSSYIPSLDEEEDDEFQFTTSSPRSDISEPRDMVTYRSSYIPSLDEEEDDEFQFTTSCRRSQQDQDDFNTDSYSDGDKYGRTYRERGYMPVYRESEYRFKPKFDSQNVYDGMPLSSSLRNTEVDKPIKLSGLSLPYSYSSYTARSEKVKIEKNSYKKNQPPFRREEELHKVGISVDKLISSLPADRVVENMPEGRKLEMLTPEESKKKKKKKKKKIRKSLL